ncbi:conserved Plasmodium protein, unknown function [Plasmodium ovale]|uniref:Uncharacterized protein n=2 Tax=Plasmodium ovale TaxID=36330 RepID=A0A1D3KYT9_PLAOA|nr:conserved Plasmodium protein, unknown function [Plasmodium ovale]
MKSMRQMNNIEESFRYLTKNVPMVSKTVEKREYGTSLNSQRQIGKVYESERNNKYEYLDSSHLEMLDLNKNILNILPKPVKPSLNLENLCKETSDTLRRNRSKLGGTQNGTAQPQHRGQPQNQTHQQQLEQHKHVKHFYELGLPENIGTYIQPLNKTENGSINGDILEKGSFPLASSPSPFFHPPNFSTKLTPSSNKFMPVHINNKSTNIYGLPSYLIPEEKPKNLTVTVVPNKNKDILEKEAKHLKQLLDNSSQGIVNSTPDYQKIISSPSLSNMKNKDKCNTVNIMGSNYDSNDDINSNGNNNNDIESDFSFGKNENMEHFENTQEQYNYENNRDSYVNEIYDGSKCRPFERINEFIMNSSYKNTEHVIHLKSNKQVERASKKVCHKGNDIASNSFNELKEDKYGEGEYNGHQYEYENENKSKNEITRVSPSKKTQLTKKKECYPSLKKLEPSTCFKNPKTYINIRLGKPKKIYITSSSDPIDKKLRDWHNTHNSQIGWKKSRRGVYTFGRTEVVLSLIHDKIIVKKINGKTIKDNLLTVEKFVSLNELFELQQEENDNLLKKRRDGRTFAF